MWFLNGANNLVIPRGTFYDSKMYGQLNGSFSSSNPLADATAYGNSNTLPSNLNGRVIQMVIAKNLTLAQAWGILDLVRTNSSGNVTAFPFFATSEFYTLRCPKSRVSPRVLLDDGLIYMASHYIVICATSRCASPTTRSRNSTSSPTMRASPVPRSPGAPFGRGCGSSGWSGPSIDTSTSSSPLRGRRGT